jgi:muramoyltetrapeptide carboxypeptidase
VIRAGAPDPIVAQGARVAVVAPASVYDPRRLEEGLVVARTAGHAPELLPDLLRPVRYLASSDEQRTTQLLEALTDPAWAAVWLARGGYGLTRILSALELSDLPKRPVVGFSDATALFALLWRRRAGPLVHGPVIHSLGRTDEGSLAHLWDVLAGRPTAPLLGETWVAGEATGPVLGGNLAVLAALCGTPWQLDARNAILVLEEVGEPAYRIDRLLQQLRDAGVFDRVAGVAVGQLVDCRVPTDATFTLRDVFLDQLVRLRVPVVGDLPIGHGPANRAFVWGTEGTLRDGRLELRPPE